MIPRAVEQVFRVTDELKNKGWEYTMEGQFLEIVSPVSRLQLTWITEGNVLSSCSV